MLSYVKGSLFESPAHVLVNTINTVGVMGKGIAKTFKAIYPDMFKIYQQLCEQKKIEIGKLWLYKASNKWILNFPTKIHWRSPSKVEYLEAGLKNFKENFADYNITSIAFPPLGCGNGDLNWEKEVRPLMEKYLKNLPIEIFIYLYDSSVFELPEHKNTEGIKKWLRSEPGSLSFSEVWDDLKLIIGNGLRLHGTLTNSEISYNIKNTIENNKTVEIVEMTRNDLTNGTSTITYKELLEVWSILRNYGFLTRRIMPLDMDKLYEEVISLFLELEYCQTVYISRQYSEVAKEVGIRINEINLPLSEKEQNVFQFTAE
jgi:O-acetyl-ADP-ribose deacetylase (regulator of RNase III)